MLVPEGSLQAKSDSWLGEDKRKKWGAAAGPAYAQKKNKKKKRSRKERSIN